jgi:hypothetical protein
VYSALILFSLALIIIDFDECRISRACLACCIRYDRISLYLWGSLIIVTVIREMLLNTILEFFQTWVSFGIQMFVRIWYFVFLILNKETESEEKKIKGTIIIYCWFNFPALADMFKVLSFLKALEDSVSKSEESSQNYQDLRSQSCNHHDHMDESQKRGPFSISCLKIAFL